VLKSSGTAPITLLRDEIAARLIDAVSVRGKAAGAAGYDCLKRSMAEVSISAPAVRSALRRIQMALYVDGFVIPVKRKELPAYLKMARLGARIWKDHGALEVFECAGDDLDTKFGVSFPKRMATRPGETVIFSWILFKSRASRDRVNAKVMKDPRMSTPPKKMPFELKRMVYGGFTVAAKS
jgi:uncharacterized protein YbaA (DUF1428 family)